MKFIIDAPLPPALVLWLREAGHEAQHVAEVGLSVADDDPIWAHAQRNGAIIITKDEDFAARAVQSMNPVSGGTNAITPVIVWFRVGNTTNRALRDWIEPRLSGIVSLIAQGQRLIEVI